MSNSELPRAKIVRVSNPSENKSLESKLPANLSGEIPNAYLASGTEPMKVGIFVTSLEPKGSSQANFQGTVLAGLERLRSDRFHFVVLSYEIPSGFQDDEYFTYVRIKRGAPRRSRGQNIRGAFGRFARATSRVLGFGSSRIARNFPPLPTSEPFVYKKLREHNIRLIWNVNQHELSTYLPYIRTVWDINHRIYSMYPEFSYTRFKFEGLDRNMSKSLGKASYVITGTEEGKREIENIYGVYPKKVRVIPFPTPTFSVPQTESDDVNGHGRRKPYLFYPARFWPHKNHIVIVAALKVLRDRWGIDFDVVFSGADEGNLRHVLDFAEKMDVLDQVEHVGLVPTDDLVRLYREAFALVFAGAVGPDNLPPLEAMSLNCPVITTDVPGAREQFGDSVLYFNPHDEVELAERIKELMESTDLRDEKVQLGKARAESWTADDYVSEVLKIISEFQLISRSWARNDATFS